MESSLRKAWVVAGIKMSIGLLVLCAVVGIRVVSVAPQTSGASSSKASTESPIAAGVSEADSRFTGEGPSTVSPEDARTQTASSASGALSRTGSHGAGPRRAGDRMVSCKIRGAAQFMTADDCALRGGQSTLFENNR